MERSSVPLSRELALTILTGGSWHTRHVKIYKGYVGLYLSVALPGYVHECHFTLVNGDYVGPDGWLCSRENFDNVCREVLFVFLKHD
jgi:hypothetical protein